MVFSCAVVSLVFMYFRIAHEEKGFPVTIVDTGNG